MNLNEIKEGIKKFDIMGKIHKANDKYDGLSKVTQFVIAMLCGMLVIPTKFFMFILIPALLFARYAGGTPKDAD
jgi:NhaP-type Na+/H+ and K+/H+ antiporter